MAGEGVTAAVGLRSGTSMDGIDAAIVNTDGERVFGFGPAQTLVYDDGFRDRLRAVLGVDPDDSDESQAVAEELTHLHAEAVKRLLGDNDLKADAIAASKRQLPQIRAHWLHSYKKDKTSGKYNNSKTSIGLYK